MPNNPSAPSPSTTSELPSLSPPTLHGQECSYAIAAPLATPSEAPFQALGVNSGARKGSISGQSKLHKENAYDVSLQQWYERMVVPNTTFLAIHADERRRQWSSAILKKKHAMQVMLEAQKTIEDVERDVSDALNGQSIKNLRLMFFCDFPDSSSPDGQYLLQLEKVAIRQ